MKLQCTTFDREDDMRIFIISFAFSCTVGWNKRLSFREKSLFINGTVVSQSIKKKFSQELLYYLSTTSFNYNIIHNFVDVLSNETHYI